MSRFEVDPKQVSTKVRGEPNTFDYRVLFEQGDHPISPFHDVPLINEDEGTYNFICEIPRGTNAKLEISKEEKWNPIKQDTKKGKLRYIGYGDYPFHYGAFPQTWEDPGHDFQETGYPGDNDPVDVCEIGNTEFATGQIVPVKVLGALAMIDDDETDWKIITIAVEDPLSKNLHNIGDVDKHMPGKLEQIREWFRLYKTSEGKPPNKFALDERFMDRMYALGVVTKSKILWDKLVRGESDPHGISLTSQRAPNC